MKLTQLKKFLDEYFKDEHTQQARKADPYLPNGLQWRGKEEIKRIALGVSANIEFFQKAADFQAEVAIVHHALGEGSPFFLYLPTLQKRLEILSKNNLSLFGYHYILDSHPQIGNNAQIIKKLGAKRLDINLHDGWGWVGEFKKPQPINKLQEKCCRIFNHEVFAVKAGKALVKRIGVVSGGGVPHAKENLELLEKEVDLYITGEISESKLHEFKELGIAYFACGHYATETFGIKALGEIIKKKFPNLEVKFIDVPNQL